MSPALHAWLAAAPPEGRALLRALRTRSAHQAETIAALLAGLAEIDAQLATVTRERDLQRCQIVDLVRLLRDSRRLQDAARVSEAATQQLLPA